MFCANTILVEGKVSTQTSMRPQLKVAIFWKR